MNEIRFLRLNELEDHKRFIKNHWNDRHIFALEDKVFNWQHRTNKYYYCIISTKGREIIGSIGIIPQKQFDNNLPNNQIFLGLLRIIEGQQIGTLLLMFDKINEYFKPEIICTTGFDDKMIKFHKWKGFKVGIMEHSFILSNKYKLYRIATVPTGYKTKPGLIDKEITWEKANHSYLMKISSEDSDRIFKNQWPNKSILFLVNRYLAHPVYNYDIYCIYRLNKLSAFIIIRKIKKFDRACLRIIDYIGTEDIFSSLFTFFQYLVDIHRAEYIDIYFHGIQSSYIEKAGLVNRNNQQNVIIPDYFEPFVKKNVVLNYGYISKNNDHRIKLFKGDGDRDRPSQIKGINL